MRKILLGWALLASTLAFSDVIPTVPWNTPRGVTGGPSTNSLSLTLTSFWKLSDLTDSVGSHTLTNNNAATFVTGQIGNAAHFVAASSQSLTVTSDSSLQANGSFTVAAWIKITDISGNYYCVSKWGAAAANEEYVLYNVVGFPSFAVVNSAIATRTVTAPFTVAAGVYRFYVGWYDSVLDSIFIQVDNQTYGPVFNGTGSLNTSATVFSIGSGGNVVHFANADVDAVGFWKRVLTADERHALWNSGQGVESTFLTVSANLFFRPHYRRTRHAA